MLTDAQLVAALPRLHRLARVWGAPAPDDLVQQTCERAIRNRDRFAGETAAPWLALMMRRLLINQWRAAHRIPSGREVLEGDWITDPAQEDHVLLREVGEVIETGEPPGVALLLPSAMGQSGLEMRAATGWARTMMHARLSHARASLRGLT